MKQRELVCLCIRLHSVKQVLNNIKGSSHRRMQFQGYTLHLYCPEKGQQ